MLVDDDRVGVGGRTGTWTSKVINVLNAREERERERYRGSKSYILPSKDLAPSPLSPSPRTPFTSESPAANISRRRVGNTSG